jgi:HD domain
MTTSLSLTDRNKQIITQIEANWATFTGLCQQDKERYSLVSKLLDAEGSKMMTCPSSTKTDFQGAYPGGLIQHSLKVTRLMASLNKTYNAEIKTESIIMTGLFHDLGKIGNDKFDYYVEKESDWHNKLGIMYDINPKLAGSPPSLRSLWLLSKYGISLTEEEFLAVASVKDRIDLSAGSDSMPSNTEPSMLSVMLGQAIKVACLSGRGKKSLLE